MASIIFLDLVFAAMTAVSFFPFVEYWHLYAGFVVLVLGLLTIDLGILHRDAHSVTMREASLWTVVWVMLALMFNVILYLYSLNKFSTDPDFTSLPNFNAAVEAKRLALEFLTGYVVEQSLSVDNIFVFVVVFRYFGIEPKYQHRVLFFGILGAIIFRALFIMLGSVLLQYELMVKLFGVFLIATGVKLIFSPEKPLEPEKNPAIKFLKRFMPVTPQLFGQSFFVSVAGKMHMTPLFVALVFLELTDIVFAVDSVPAIFAITSEPLIVFTSNIFAILGLRSLYFLLQGAVDKFHLLKYGLGIILGFVGLKMVALNHMFGGKFPIEISLMIIIGVLASSIGLSLLFPKREARGQ